MKTNNLESQLAAIDTKAEQEKQAVILQAQICDKVAAIPTENVIVYSHYKKPTVSFGWRTSLTKDEVNAVLAAFPIDGNNYEMKFASSEKNFITDSSLIVRWENSHTYHHQKTFKIEYQSGEYQIFMTVPVSHFGAHVWYRQHKGKHTGFGRYEMFNDMFIDYFYTQSYSGGYNTLYFLEGAESLKEYENFIVTGEFKYENEITK